MHTIKDVVANTMDVVKGEKGFCIASLEITSQNLAVADERYSKLNIPEWMRLPKQKTMISAPTALKSHDWKQVSFFKLLISYQCTTFFEVCTFLDAFKFLTILTYE